MQYRQFGSLDWKVSALGFGTMRLPSRRLNRIRPDADESIRIIRRGIDLGINYIDTAWPYHLGESERIVGQALRDGYRERVHLVTKLPVFVASRPQDFERFLSGQMRKLQTEILDIYLLHALDAGSFEKAKRLGFFEKLAEAKRQGRIRHVGFSFHDTLPVFRDIVDFYDWDMAQIQYNYMDTGVQATTDGLIYAHSKGIAAVIMEPLKGGQLANPPTEALEVMRSAGVERTPVDWALQFLWDRPEVSCVLSGMGSRQMVEENCASAHRSGIGSLNSEEGAVIARLAEIYRSRIQVPCTACQYCMPCPAGVNIPKNFAILNNVSMESGWYRRWRARRSYRQLSSSADERSKENPNGNATLCVECGQCLEKCPQHIAIPDELKRVDAILGRRENITDHYGN